MGDLTRLRLGEFVKKFLPNLVRARCSRREQDAHTPGIFFSGDLLGTRSVACFKLSLILRLLSVACLFSIGESLSLIAHANSNVGDLSGNDAGGDDFWLDINPVIAQNTGQRERIPQPPPDPLPLPDAPILPPPETPEMPMPGDNNDTQVMVRDIQVQGSTIFEEADWAAVLDAFENQLLTITELQQAADAITQLYVSRGYITSRALLSNQTITDGIVRIQVIEGSLETIRVAGSDRLTDYIRSRIALE